MDLTHRLNAISDLMGEKLGVHGAGLAVRLVRAGRLLPKHLRRELAYAVAAERLAQHPKLARQIDWDRIARAEAEAHAYLDPINPWERRKNQIIDWASGVIVSLLLLAGLVYLVLRWIEA
ncbi:MAG: hypothetical protein CR993_04160 [Rhodobacterales bacterium]|nr:MAG: hypothetical protein CR993_04160 [Rhodobacterales bacterium]